MTHPLLQLSHPDLAATVAALQRVSDDLERRRRVTERQVDVLLDGGWSGAAARSYLEGWEEWRLGCDEVLGALRSLTALILDAGAEADGADDSARTALVSLTRRLVERLG